MLQMSALLPSFCGSLPETLTHNPLITSCRSQLQQYSCVWALSILQDRSDVTQREITQLLGVSTNGLNKELKSEVGVSGNDGKQKV